jgi:hypothetical protein
MEIRFGLSGLAGILLDPYTLAWAVYEGMKTQAGL